MFAEYLPKCCMWLVCLSNVVVNPMITSIAAKYSNNISCAICDAIKL